MGFRTTRRTGKAIASLLPLAAYLSSVAATPCVSFDASFNLYVFGGNQDLALGPQDAWFQLGYQGEPLPAEGRPPFDGANTKCFLAQFFNAVYVLDGDASQPDAIHIFNFGTRAWSTQAVDRSAGVNHSTVVPILDRDTNVFFGVDNGQLYEMAMDTLADAGSGRFWQQIGTPPFEVSQPVMAVADNRIFFLNTGVEGEARLFRIHFSTFIEQEQTYPGTEGRNFPSQHGAATSFFLGSDHVQTHLAFMPDDGSTTAIIDVTTNTTEILAAPPSDPPGSAFTASQTALVQLTSDRELYALIWSPEDQAANAFAGWTKINVDNLGFGAKEDSSSTGASTTGTRRNTQTRSSEEPNTTNPAFGDTGAAGKAEMGYWMMLSGLVAGGLSMLF